jgi:hypothetical protein
MNNNFVPFAASLIAAADPKQPSPPPASGAVRSTPFRPLSAAPASERTPSPQAVSEPRISLERDGQRVTRITIQCPCGHTVELDCID